MNIRRRLLFAATGCASLALALSGCAGLAPQPAVTVTAPAADSGGTSTPAPGESSPVPDEASAAPVPSPSLLPDQCAPLTEAADGVYAAGDAGSATVVRVGPRGLELRHLRGLPAADATRIRELFAEVVDAGGACQGDAWEVLHLWRLGSSPSAVAAANAVMILVCRAVEAELAAEETAACPPRP